MSGNAATYPLEMEPCRSEDWSRIDESIFNDYQLSQSYCLKDRSQLRINGYFTSPSFTLVHMAIKQCDNTTSPVPCAPQDDIDAFILNNSFGGYIVGKVVILNAAINPSQRNAVSYEID